MEEGFYNDLLKSIEKNRELLAILIDPDKFDVSKTHFFLKSIPKQTTYLFVGGSDVENGATDRTVRSLKLNSQLPIFLFPGDHSQISEQADALLFLTLLSGRNPEYLIGQQVKAVTLLKNTSLEIIPTGYILIDGGTVSAVSRITKTEPIPQDSLDLIINTAVAGQYMGAKFIYLEAGSGALFPIDPIIISEVKKAIKIPLIVGGGIKTELQKQSAYQAGADMVVMGTVYEKEMI